MVTNTVKIIKVTLVVVYPAFLRKIRMKPSTSAVEIFAEKSLGTLLK